MLSLTKKKKKKKEKSNTKMNNLPHMLIKRKDSGKIKTTVRSQINAITLGNIEGCS